jgi:hypothetical protein
MGFNFASKGTRIVVGEKLTLPLTVQEPAILHIQWSSADELEVEFSATFKASGSEEVNALIPAEKAHTKECSIDMTNLGEAVLEWNHCFAGYLWTNPCALSYTVTLMTTKEMEEEQKRKEAALEEERRQEQLRLEEERRQKAREEAEQREAVRKEKLAVLKKSVDEVTAELDGENKEIAEKESDLAEEQQRLKKFQEMVAEFEEVLAAKKERASALQARVDSMTSEISELVAASDADRAGLEVENGHTNGFAKVTYADLETGGAYMTNKIIDAFSGNADFLAAGKRKLCELVARDQEDGGALQKGIDLGVAKGVLEAEVQVEPIIKVNVTGRSPDSIAEEIKSKLGDAPSKGCSLTIQGLSGLGKGTTVDKLKTILPKAQTWSNGDIFRSITLLATRFAIQEKFSEEEREKFKDIIVDLKGEGELKQEFDARIKELFTPENVLTKENIASFFGMLDFGKFNGDKLDTKIEGLGMIYYVSEVNTTVLKTISKFIPPVSAVTQGEVIGFIQMALGKLTENGFNVLLEGREQTLNYIRTPHRFELVTDDNTVIGKRQAALIMGSCAKQTLAPGTDDAAVKIALEAELAKLDK